MGLSLLVIASLALTPTDSETVRNQGWIFHAGESLIVTSGRFHKQNTALVENICLQFWRGLLWLPHLGSEANLHHPSFESLFWFGVWPPCATSGHTGQYLFSHWQIRQLWLPVTYLTFQVSIICSAPLGDRCPACLISSRRRGAHIWGSQTVAHCNAMSNCATFRWSAKQSITKCQLAWKLPQIPQSTTMSQSDTLYQV